MAAVLDGAILASTQSWLARADIAPAGFFQQLGSFMGSMFVNADDSALLKYAVLVFLER